MDKMKDKGRKRGKKKKLNGRKGKGPTLQQRLQERDEHMKGGPPNCVICLAPINPQSSSCSSAGTGFDGSSPSSTLNQVMSIHLCEVLDIPLSFKEGFLEYPCCAGCYQVVEMISILLVQLPSQDSVRERQKELEDLESVVSQVKSSLRSFQTKTGSKEKQLSQELEPSGELFSFRAKVYREMISTENQVKLSSQNESFSTKDIESSSIKLEFFPNVTDNPLDTAGPPNCLVCMRGSSESLELQPLLQGECLDLLKLLSLPDKLKQDFIGAKTYACSSCLLKVKNVTDMYKQIERINIRLGEARDFFEQGFLELPTPNARAASLINPDLVGFVILRRRMAKELNIVKGKGVHPSHEYPGPSTRCAVSPAFPSPTLLDENEEEPPPRPPARQRNNVQNFCEVVIEDYSDQDDPSDEDSDSQNPSQGKRVYSDKSCPYCDMTYKCYRSLHKHLNRIHFDILPFNCKLCDQGFTNKDKLEKHENAVHLGFKNNECRICRKVFSRRGAMKTHEAKHSGVRSFQCELCDKNYLALGALRKHMEAIHGNNKFVCEVCGKELPSKHYLSAHVRKHQQREAGIVAPRHKYPIGRGNTPIVLNFDPVSIILEKKSGTESQSMDNNSSQSTDESQLDQNSSGVDM